MPHTKTPEIDTPLWQKYVIEAAINYYNDRGIKPGILIDNSILQDGVLQAKQMEGHHEFVICVAPGYTTQLSYDTMEMTVTACFDSFEHVMHIPYHAIRAVLAIGIGVLLSTDGHTNIIKVPPVVYPPRAKREKDPIPQAEPIEISQLEQQPPQEELSVIPPISAYRR